MTKRVPLTEDVLRQPAPLRVDRERGVAYDVKLLGWVSTNSRIYDRDGCSKPEVLALYEGAPSCIDHPDPSGGSRGRGRGRGFAERFARVHGVYASDDGLYAKEYRFNPAHPLAATFAWWAQNDPHMIGLSHRVVGDAVQESDGSTTVKPIVEVISVDLCGETATTNGLYESPMDPLSPETPATPDPDFKAQLGELAKAIVAGNEFDVAEMRDKLNKLLKLLPDQPDAGDETPEPPADEPGPKDDKTKEESLTPVERNELNELRADKTRRANVDAARALCESLLPKAAVTNELAEAVAAIPDAGLRKRHVEGLRRLATPSKTPIAPGADAPTLTLDSFLANLPK